MAQDPEDSANAGEPRPDSDDAPVADAAKDADSSTRGGNDLGDEDPWRLPAPGGASAAAPETGTRRLFTQSRAKSSRVSGGAELVIPDCLVRLDKGAASGAVSGVIESKIASEASAEPESKDSPAQVASMEAKDSLPVELSGEGQTPSAPRDRSNSQPAMLVEDHDLVEVVDEVDEVDASSTVLEEDLGATVAPPPPTSNGMEEDPAATGAWHERFFEQGTGPIVASGGDEEAQRDVEFVALCTGLTSDHSVLDLGSGNGRHCFAMVDQGYNVLGIERSPYQLELANERNAKRVRKAQFQAGDFRSLSLGREFDVVTCLGSSFGYFSEEENLCCLEQMRNCVKPGGLLVLQSFNRDFVVSKVPCRSWWSDSGYLVLDEVDYNYVTERLRVKRTMLGDSGQQTEHLIEIRAYALRELCLLLATAGLQVVEISGSRGTRGYYYGADSSEMWLIARRPA